MGKDQEQTLVEQSGSKKMNRREFLTKLGEAGFALWFGGAGKAFAQEGRPTPTPTPIPTTEAEPESVALQSTEVSNGKPAFQEIVGQGVEGYYSVTASIDEIVVGTYEEPQSFPIGADLTGGAFAIVSYEGKSGLQKVAIPLAFVSENKTYVNKGPEGIIMWEFKYEIPELTALALQYAVTPNEGKTHMGIAFADSTGNGMGNTDNIKPVIDELYPTGALVNFLTTENSADLPELGNVNGVPILVNVFSVFIE